MLCQECKPTRRDDAYVVLLGPAKIESRLIHTKQHATDIAKYLSKTESRKHEFNCIPERVAPSKLEMFKELK